MSAGQLPEKVKDFVRYFHAHLNDHNVDELQVIYENVFPALTERFYKDGKAYQPWPAASVLSDLVGGDPLFLMLYNELCFRHLHTRVSNQLTLAHRFASYDNYCSLFSYILEAATPVDLQLPTIWLWDMVDEFIYQFQTFNFYTTVRLTDEYDAEVVKQQAAKWNVHVVINVLMRLADKACIGEQLAEEHAGRPVAEVAGDFGTSPLYYALGFNSLVALLRLHTSLGDYHEALRVIEHLRVPKRNKIVVCHTTVAYCTGFCYLMLRRYQDAARVLANAVFKIMRSPAPATHVGGFDTVKKQKEQMLRLLAIAMTLSPQRIDEVVHLLLLEKTGGDIARMQAGDLSAMEELFLAGCPKFVITPQYTSVVSGNKDPSKHQLSVFLQGATQQHLFATARSFLKLYTSIPLSKLAVFMNLDVDALRTLLFQLKTHTHQVVWVSGGPLSGERQPSTDIDFYIRDDMVHVADVKVARSYGGFFVDQIHKMALADQ